MPYTEFLFFQTMLSLTMSEHPDVLQFQDITSRNKTIFDWNLATLVTPMSHYWDSSLCPDLLLLDLKHLKPITEKLIAMQFYITSAMRLKNLGWPAEVIKII
jgi:hypothetical protein